MKGVLAHVPGRRQGGGSEWAHVLVLCRDGMDKADTEAPWRPSAH